MKDYDGKKERSLKELAVLDSTYGEIARYVLWGDEKIKDITNWMYTCNITDMLLH